ncbi:MAG TPA: hypothetical protein VJV78_24765 [Polyangiales bacterium]|nr:hypothetical protein [Polyangiales bacterium]
MSAPERERRRTRRLASGLVLACLLSALVGVWLPEGARSQEHNFAGSLQTNYLGVVTDRDAYKNTFDGFTNELSIKVAVDFNDNVSANVKLCYGCHGVELGMAFADLRVIDELNFRVGRFTPAFGDFPLRHDPANHRTSDKPLPYDMGRMLRMRTFNFGVLPAPYVDQGLEISGTHWFGDDVQFDYAVHVVGGLRSQNDAMDLDFMLSRSVYYVDNNSEPAFGGRLALTIDISEDVLLTVGGSLMAGRPDPARELSYAIAGTDIYLRLWEFDLHAEYMIRRQQMPLGDDPDSKFKYGPNADGEYDDFFIKDGFYVEGTLPVSARLELVARFDGLRRIGNVTLNSQLRRKSGILRYTAGLNVVLDGSVRLKFSGEFYDFSDFEDEVALNAGVAAAF